MILKHPILPLHLVSNTCPHELLLVLDHAPHLSSNQLHLIFHIKLYGSLVEFFWQLLAILNKLSVQEFLEFQCVYFGLSNTGHKVEVLILFAIQPLLHVTDLHPEGVYIVFCD